MTQDDFNAYCASLAHTTHVVQWGGSDVWKIGGKIFALAGWDEQTKTAQDNVAVVFKVSDMAWEMFKDAAGVRPAPYMASRGMKWLQRTRNDTISDEDLKELIRESYHLVAAKLTKKLQRELGLST
ncbi:MAG: MmcQ/YjbR family DNA-binding protein [Pseudomonadota bacterium]